jgi:tetratricopeptide (TPR) repeat protein
MKRSLVIAALLLLAAFGAQAATFNQQSVEKFIKELEPHARDYPPRFDSPAQGDLMRKQLRDMLPSINAASTGNPKDPQLLFLKAYANGMGHNLDVPGCAELAVAAYIELIALRPKFGRAYFYLGTFLAGSGQGAESIPYLLTAIELGETGARYPLGFMYLMQGDKRSALEQFKAYLKTNPGDAMARKVVADLETGKNSVSFGSAPLGAPVPPTK